MTDKYDASQPTTNSKETLIGETIRLETEAATKKTAAERFSALVKKHKIDPTEEFEMTANIECNHEPRVIGGMHTPPGTEWFPVDGELCLSMEGASCSISLTNDQERVIEKMIKKHVEYLRKQAANVA